MDHVDAPLPQNKKGTRSIPASTTFVDINTWPHEAPQARDKEAVQWFTRTILRVSTTPQKL